MALPPFRPIEDYSLAVFSLLVAVYFAFQLQGLRISRARPAVWAGATLFYLVFFGLVGSGAVLEHILPLTPILLVLNFAFYLGIALLPEGRKLARELSLRSLISLQIFRLPLELVLHHWTTTGTIPETMTWTGQNFDILTGLLALVSAFWVNRFRWLAWVNEIVGSVLLLNVVRVAVLSSPVPFAWQLDVPLQLLFYLPYAGIVPFCVGSALCLHVLTARKLLDRSPSESVVRA